MNTEPDSQNDDDFDDNVPDASELLDFELIAKSQPEKSGSLWLWVILVLVLGGGGWAGWMYVDGQNEEELTAAGGVPMILAPKFDLKTKPVDPGGMKIPDRDKLVYDRMAGEQNTGGAGQVERLLPPPEAPIQPPKEMSKPVEAPKQTAESVAVASASSPAAPTEAKPEAKAEPVAEPKPIAPPPAPKAVEAPAPKPEPVTRPALAPSATGAAGQGYMIQLSAVRNEANAKSEWARLAKKHPDILGGLKLVIQRADLGAKGVFYRVRGGWFANRAEAKAVCDQLAKRNVGCLIAKP